MIRGNELEQQAYDPAHQKRVIEAITEIFPTYFSTFAHKPLDDLFKEYLEKHANEQEAYRDYIDRLALQEFEYDPNAFKSHTRKRCPIIQRCLWSQDEVMKAYKRSFNDITGRQLLDAVGKIAYFAIKYVANFDDEAHEAAVTPDDLGINVLNEPEYGCRGVVGFGVQSSMLYGVYPWCFAHRSQNAVWSLYFLSGRKNFGLEDGSEFMMAEPEYGTCEQNYFYPAQLFGFYALRVYLLLKSACAEAGIKFYDRNRYIYLSAFCDHVADRHREDINMFKRSSDYVEAHWF